MSRIRFQLDRKGVMELMKSPEMESVLDEYASGVMDRCGKGYEKNLHRGKTRSNAMVFAKSARAKLENNRNNTLLKAIK